MTTPAPDWADDEHQFRLISILSDITGITDAQIIAVQEWALTAVSRAYVNGRHDGERSGIIKGLREAAKEVRGRVLSDRIQYAPKKGGEADVYLQGMWAAESYIRALAKSMEKGQP